MGLLIPYLEELSLVKVWEQAEAESWDREYWLEIEGLPLLKVVTGLYENMEMTEDDYMKMSSDVDFAVQYHYEVFRKAVLQGKAQDRV